MDKQLQVILIGMLVDFTRKEILEKEIIFGAKKGIGAETLEKTINVDEIIHRILGEEKTAVGI